MTISCGYFRISALPVTWMINGTSFDQQAIMDSPLYQLNNPNTPLRVSLTVFSINSTTTFQCVVQSIPSTRGAVTVISGMYVRELSLSTIVLNSRDWSEIVWLRALKSTLQ